jgi:hypothetical protein
MWEPRRLTNLWAFTACYRDSVQGQLYIYLFFSYAHLRRSHVFLILKCWSSHSPSNLSLRLFIYPLYLVFHSALRGTAQHSMRLQSGRSRKRSFDFGQGQEILLLSTESTSSLLANWYREQSGRSVNPTTHLSPVARLRMSRGIIWLPHMSSWCGV